MKRTAPSMPTSDFELMLASAFVIRKIQIKIKPIREVLSGAFITLIFPPRGGQLPLSSH